MRIGLGIGAPYEPARSLSELVPEIEQAERDGFDAVWAADLPFVMGLNTMTLMAAGAARTTRVGVGSYVAPIYAYPPTTLAQQALSIQIVSGGRYVLGVGLGHQVLLEDMLGLKIDRPLAYLREYLGVLMPLLRGEAIDHHGEFFDIRIDPAMGAPPCPPVLIAALGPQMLRLAGTLADGTGLTMTRAASDASRGPLRIAFAVPLSVTNEVEAAKSAVRSMIPYENLPAYRRLLDADGLRDAADISIIGDEATVRAGLGRLADLGVTDLVAIQLRYSEDPGAGDRTRQLLTELSAAGV